MGIDGIGRGGPPAPTGTGPTGEGSSVGGLRGRTFEVGDARTTSDVQGTAGAAEAAPSDALRALDRGELTPAQYLDAQVASATHHLEGRISAEQLSEIRGALREELGADPVLMEWVRRATGRGEPGS